MQVLSCAPMIVSHIIYWSVEREEVVMVQGHYREKKAQVFIVSSFSPFENLLMINASSFFSTSHRNQPHDVLWKCQGRINVTENTHASPFIPITVHSESFLLVFSTCESLSNFKTERDGFSINLHPVPFPLTAEPTTKFNKLRRK